MKIGDKVRINDRFLSEFPNCPDREGVIVGVSEEGCVYGETYEVEFESGNCDYMYPCDLEAVESESPYEEDGGEIEELLERAQAMRDEYDLVSR